MKKIALFLIGQYQYYLSLESGLLGKVVGYKKICRFEPRCSEYARQAITRYGIIGGLFLAGRRIIKCHPLNPGGYDPVPINTDTSNK